MPRVLNDEAVARLTKALSTLDSQYMFQLGVGERRFIIDMQKRIQGKSRGADIRPAETNKVLGILYRLENPNAA